ncbi:MAG TPA: hypothetical protein VNK70_00755, partial [Candidatus Paceibacterota bacterium]|nr:hypothetical protein [Candidatus Paceibacterota bacterium]
GIYGTQDSTVGSVKLGSGGGIISGSGGNIGIGTTGPASTLDVRSGSGGGISGPTSGTWTARIVNNQDASGQNGLSVQNRWNSTDSYIFEAAKGWNGTAVGYYPVFTINGLGNVGIGTRSPSSTLHIVPGQVRLAGTTNPYLGLNDGTYQAYLEIASGAMRLYHNGVDRLNITAATDSVITLTPGSTNGKVVIAGSGKLDAATVDPVYTIGGKRYATYLPGMTGVKEETTGVAQLSKLNFNNSEVQLQYIIDFNKAEIGSDLWLFAQAINISGRAYVAPDGKVYRTSAEEIFDNFSVLLSPGFDGRVWYEKDVESRTITIYAVPSNSLEIRNSSFEVSYRLTAPRFDWKYWTNYSDSEWEGLNLDKSLR